ncbi:MAG: cytidylyltransferase [SAR116 cluster bacterium]|nr:cytidylyltransferase [SAR116 cluster bacterium]RPH12293.1 MAG: acylneuraminate cytidylyltransferase family protein [Alphaproteobacteria bacterium TMED54]
MINNKKILAITLARGGSKTVPKKNIKKILGKPLIAYTIEEVLKSKYIDDYIVSTDSKEIAKVSIKYGAKVPFYRPKNISNDKAAPQDALYHGLTKYEKITKQKFDYILEIMCTNPLKNVSDIDKCIEKLHKTKADTVISVQRLFDHHPIRIKKIENDLIKDFVLPENERTRRQDLRPEAYIRNGSIYAISRLTLIEHKSKIGKISRPYIMPEERSINIDEKIDFILAENIIKQKIGS